VLRDYLELEIRREAMMLSEACAVTETSGRVTPENRARDRRSDPARLTHSAMRATFVTQKHLDDGFARGGAEASPALAWQEVAGKKLVKPVSGGATAHFKDQYMSFATGSHTVCRALVCAR
jgi:hypothetical protein